jgi:hypothetical protein
VTTLEFFKYIAGPAVIVVGVLVIVFRKPWSAAARKARRARGDSEQQIATQNPVFYIVCGAFAIVWGVAVLLFVRV